MDSEKNKKSEESVSLLEDKTIIDVNEPEQGTNNVELETQTNGSSEVPSPSKPKVYSSSLIQFFLREMFVLNIKYDEETTNKIALKNKILKVLDKKWVKLMISLFILLSFPLCIVFALIFRSNIPITFLIVIQLAAFGLLFPRTMTKCLLLYKDLRFYQFGLAIISITVTSGLVVLFALIPNEILQWTFLQYLSDGKETNLLDYGFNIHPVMTLCFYLLTLVVLPVAAYFEEIVFRRGTKNWFDGTWRSILFGLVHFTMGVPLSSLLPLSLMGFWFTREYFQGVQRFKRRVRHEKFIVEEDYQDFVEHSCKNLCSFSPTSQVGCFGEELLPQGNVWKTRIDWNSHELLYMNPVTNEVTPHRPVQLLAKDAGIRASALVHLAHNFLAITVTTIFVLVNQIFNVGLPNI